MIKPAVNAPIIEDKLKHVAIQDNSIKNKKDIKSLASHAWILFNKIMALRNNHGPKEIAPVKNMTVAIIILILAAKSSLPVMIILLITANMTRPKTSSNIAAPKIVLASRECN